MPWEDSPTDERQPRSRLSRCRCECASQHSASGIEHETPGTKQNAAQGGSASARYLSAFRSAPRSFDDPNLPGQIQVTVTLKKVSLGTELNIVQEGLPDAIPLEACYLGWQESLRNLAKLVEPEINQ